MLKVVRDWWTVIFCFDGEQMFCLARERTIRVYINEGLMSCVVEGLKCLVWVSPERKWRMFPPLHSPQPPLCEEELQEPHGLWWIFSSRNSLFLLFFLSFPKNSQITQTNLPLFPFQFCATFNYLIHQIFIQTPSPWDLQLASAVVSHAVIWTGLAGGIRAPFGPWLTVWQGIFTLCCSSVSAASV